MKMTDTLSRRAGTQFIALTQKAIARCNLGSARAPVNIATTVFAVVLLSGCVTSQMQSTLNQASKIETECEAVVTGRAYIARADEL